MWNRIRYVLDFFTPITRREFVKSMNNVVIILNGMQEESAQQAEIITNLIAKLSETQGKKEVEEKSEQENDVAFS